MNETTANPCLACSIGQGCCTRLSGLRLTGREFEEHFARHLRAMSVLRYGGSFIVSARDGHGCPHWGENGCRIYASRPIDCRLFPYTVSRMAARGRRVVIEFHDRTDCPRKELLPPEPMARELLAAFARAAFGPNKDVIIRRSRPRTGIRRCLNLLDPLLAGLAKLLRAYR